MGVRPRAGPARLAVPAAAGFLLAAGCLPLRLEKPAAPGSVLASPTSAHSITLAWVDNSHDEDGFRVERVDETADEQGQKSEHVTSVASPGRGTVRYEVTGLDPRTDYRFRVVAFNKA